MVGWLSYGNKKFEALDSQMRTLIPPLRQAMFDFIPMIDADTNAFSGFMVNLNLYYVRALLQLSRILGCTRLYSTALVCSRRLSCALKSCYVLPTALVSFCQFTSTFVYSFVLSSTDVHSSICILLKFMKSNEIRSSIAHMLLC